jgi:hypothetical protein
MSKEFPIVGFEKWLQTGKGKRCLSMQGLTKEYLKNRLWWAYHAGVQSKDIKLISPIEDIIRDIAELKGKYLPQRIKDKAKYILQNREDYIKL